MGIDDAGEGSVHAVSGTFSQGQTVLSQCYPRPLSWVEVQNPTSDAWTGSVLYSVDAGATFNALTCSAGCSSAGLTRSIVVDGDASAAAQAPTSCLNKQACQLTEAVAAVQW